MRGSHIPSAAQLIGTAHCGPSVPVLWRVRAIRGDVARLQVGDAVAVLVSSGAGLTAVNVVRRGDFNDDDGRVAFFRTVAVLVTERKTAAAVVQPFLAATGNDHWRLEKAPLLFLSLDGVRLALVLHDFCAACAVTAAGIMHTKANRWLLFGNEAVYPVRSG